MSRASKFLSLILRHEPHRVGVTLDANGWASVDALLAGLAANGVPLTPDELFAIVRDSDKQRFALSEDRTRIRANQGHSVQIELNLPDAIPPARLYHGTYQEALASIYATGLSKGTRHAVHLAAETTTATKVGMRKGAPVILTIRADEMIAEGLKFQQSANGVWLTDHVPKRFIDFPSEADRPEWRHWAGSDAKPRTEIAIETERAVKEGAYTAPSGARISITATTELARRRTVMYEPGARFKPSTKQHATTFSVVAESTNQAIYRLLAKPDPGHVCAMNFASAKNPGGGWRGGARAQEESMARASALVACLETQPAYYARNRATRSALYLDLVLFSPLVPFFRDDDGTWLEKPALASVITVAAPNATALRQHGELRAPANKKSSKVPASSGTTSSGAAAGASSSSVGTTPTGATSSSSSAAFDADEVSAESSGALDALGDDNDSSAESSGAFDALDDSEASAESSGAFDALDESSAESSGAFDAASSGELEAVDENESSADSSGAFDALDESESSAESSGSFDVASSGELEAIDDEPGDGSHPGELVASDDGIPDDIEPESSDEIDAAIVAELSATTPRTSKTPATGAPVRTTSAPSVPAALPRPTRSSKRRRTRRPMRITEAELEATLRRRARLALDACVHHRVDRLILGAWGAGVFGNDPDLIADCFAVPLFGDLRGAFVEVVFAILGGPGAANYDAFAKRFPPVGVQ